MESDKVNRKLNIRQEKFCVIYASDREFFGNGTEAYAEAYEMDKTKPNWYMTAAQSASRLLKHVNITNKINALLIETGFNDAFIDKQLSFLVAQHADLPTKLNAIREFNKLKKRIDDRPQIDIHVPKPIYGGKSKGKK